MPSFIRDPKDFWSGVIFLLVGLGAVLIGGDYAMGTAGRMGPAYFPTILGGLLALIGAIAIGRSMIKPGAAVEAFAVKPLVLILGAVLIFGFIVRGAGLAVSVIVLVMISGYACAKFRVRSFLILAIGLAVFSVLVFIKGIGLPMAMFGPWFGI